MEHRTHHRATALTVAGLATLAVLTLWSGPADASRIPADPMTFVGTPASLSRLVIDNQAAHVRAALQDLRDA